jgi:glycine betaine/proline transport system permease protein
MADQSNPWDTAPAADSAAQSADAWGTSTPRRPMAAVPTG